MKAIKLTLVALGIIFFSSGCAQKEPDVVTKIEYVREEPWKFEKIDMAGVYIELGSKEEQRMCTPALMKLDEVHRGVRKFYEEQIDAYEESRDGI